MRIFKLVGALVLVLVSSAVAVATASAAETLWRWLPGSAKETFTGKSGKVTIQIKNAGKTIIGCNGSSTLLTDSALKASSELLENEAKLALGILHFTQCTSLGLAINSEGDASGIILMHLEIHNCLIAPGDRGLLMRVLPLHFEMPATKKLLLLRGAFIGLISEKTKLTYELNIKQKEGKQEIEKCEGGAADTLEVAEEGEKFDPAGIEFKEAFITFDMTKDTTGEEMMES